MKKFIDIIGWIGAAEVIAAYALNSYGEFTADSALFQLLNLTGAVFLIANTWYNKAYPSMVINIIWTLIAIVALIKIL
ncbi:MAG TPA: hypothetical protein VF473_09725 [Cyclobacteriaceae bacterium]